jgi:hypothetical protein
MMTTADSSHIRQLVTAAVALVLDMMKIQIPRGAAAVHGAAMMIARKHLAPDARGDRRRRARRLRRIERADQLGVARRSRDDLGADLDLAPGAVLPAAFA